MKKYFLLPIFLFLTLLTPLSAAESRLPPIYPVWGYNMQDNVCQIKQAREDSPAREELEGYYYDLRDCRSNNRKIIFYTGRGILVWAALFVGIFCLHYFVYPRMKKLSQTEKTLAVIQDIVIIGVVLFFAVLLQHYFGFTRATYPYPSDIDHIIYSTFIYDHFPISIFSFYVLLSILRTFQLKKSSYENPKK